MKYKIKIDDVYIYNKQIMINYKLYCKHKQKEYSLCAMVSGLSIKDFLTDWYAINIKKEFNLKF